jgi:ADP-heptose:LPS heptosyltransferase
MAKALERHLKRLGLAGLARLTPRPGPKPTERDLAAVQRILVVRPDERLGNAILITPLLVALKTRFPNATLRCLISRRYWDLHEFLPGADEFLSFDKRHYARNPLAFAGLIRRLRRIHYDLVFDCSGDHAVSFTHLALASLSGGRFRIGYDRPEAAGCYDVAVPLSDARRHATQMHLDLLRAITTFATDPRPQLRRSSDSGFAARFFAEHSLDRSRPIIVIHPGARGPKRWPAAKFAAVARTLAAENGAQVIAVWGPADQIAVDEFLPAASPAVVPAGILPFRDFISLVAAGDIFLSADCGPMHLAAAVPPKRGTCALFTTDTMPLYRPLGPTDIAIDARDSSLSPAVVVEALRRMIDGRVDRAPDAPITAVQGRVA